MSSGVWQELENPIIYDKKLFTDAPCLTMGLSSDKSIVC